MPGLPYIFSYLAIKYNKNAAAKPVTARYVPTNKVVKNSMEKEEFQKWEGNRYNEYSSEPFVEFINPCTPIVLDVQGDGDAGSAGCYNCRFAVCQLPFYFIHNFSIICGILCQQYCIASIGKIRCYI